MIENGKESNGIGNVIETATASVSGNEILIVEIARGSANSWSVERTGLAAQTSQTDVLPNETTETDLLWTIGRETDLQAVLTLGFPAPRPRAPILTPLRQPHHPLLLLFLLHRTESQIKHSNSSSNNNNSNLLLYHLVLLLPLLSPIKPANRLPLNLTVMLTDQNPCPLVQNRPKTFRLLSALLPRLLRKCLRLAQ